MLLIVKGSFMISIIKKKNSKNLYVQFYIDGKCVQRSTKLEDTPKNRKFIKNKIIPSLELKIARGEFNQQQEKNNSDFKYYAIKYLAHKDTLKTYNQLSSMVNNQILPTFKDRNIKDIKRYDIKMFVDELLKKATPKRVRMILNTVGAIIDIAIDYEVVTINVARNIPLPKHIKKEFDPFTKDEVNKLISNADGWFQVFLAVSFFTGARTGEVLALTWNDIDLDRGIISITKGLRNGIIDTPKTKTSIRDIPIFDALVPYLKDHMKNSRDMALFINPRTDKMFYKSARLTPYWKKLLEKCNLTYRILYSTRHTFITNMLKSGSFSMLDIAQLVGHSNTEMIIKNYAKFIKGEHLKIDKKVNIFTDNFTNTIQQIS